VIGGLLAYAARAVSGASVRWTEPPREGVQRVYFANHSSHLDFLVVWAALPPRVRATTRPVAAADYWQAGPLRRWLAGRVFHAVLIARRTRAHEAPAGQLAVERLLEAIDEGASLIVFPEGTRGNGTVIAPFKSGLYHLCVARPQLELVPVHLDNLNRVLPKGEAVPVPLISRVTFGAPLRLAEAEDKPAFLERAHTSVVELGGE
jgi:1-acyl-sn-glycerol-3-phosphate acyltransferase